MSICKRPAGTREVLLGLLDDIELIIKEMIEGAIGGLQGQRAFSVDQKMLTDLLITKQNDLKRGLQLAAEQAVIEEKITIVQAQVDKQHEEIRLLQTRLKDAEHALATAIFQAKQKLASIQKANKRPVSSEDLIKYAHRISCTNAVQAPLNWQQGDPRRPYPTDIEMRCGFLGRTGELPLQYPPGTPMGLGLDAFGGVKFPTPPLPTIGVGDVGVPGGAGGFGSNYPWNSSDIHLAMGKGDMKSRDNAEDVEVICSVVMIASRCPVSTSVKKAKLLTPCAVVIGQERNVAFIVARVLRGALKIRYLLLGGALGGGYQLQKTFDSWREKVPDLKWVEDYFPDASNLDKFRGTMLTFRDRLSEGIEEIQLDPKLKAMGIETYNDLKSWFDHHVNEALRKAEERKELALEVRRKSEVIPVTGRFSAGQDSPLGFATDLSATEGDFREYESPFKFGLSVKAASADNAEESRRIADLREKLQKKEGEVMQVQLKYQRELEKIERENRELRKQLMLSAREKVSNKKIKKSLIDMYSEVLDELSGYDSSYNTQDHLPRVVVVGDQSSGKTSVLEMIAQARIFPRGAGEMMTRAPVQVTLSEGPYHVAQFKDSDREFDLTKESDLADLRREVELRMINSVRGGKTVSNEVISMTVKGPGLQRMVLVDLPGIISTQTNEMAADTRDSIRQMSQTFMSNPNAIILCIQDGSVDAERSNVTDLVSQMDPLGKRTIFVLTKVDLAEENLANPKRVKKILSGSLFPMKALGYFAVVTGRGNKNDSISDIKNYEEKFFRDSQIFRHGIVNSTQLTTRNLSFAVSELFWKMVRETVEQQADAFKASRFNLETEWRHNFPRLRELDRDELFEKARGEILDEVVALGQLSAKEWEEMLSKKIWSRVAPYVFDSIYLPAAASTNNAGTFNTTVDIKLKEWAERLLPEKCVEVGWETLREGFSSLIEKTKGAKDHDAIFDVLKQAVVEEACGRHHWEDKAEEVLRVIQLNTLEDRAVAEKHQWDEAVKFLEMSLGERLQQTEDILKEMTGPGAWERWVYWKYANADQGIRRQTRSELERLIRSDDEHAPMLSYEELTTVRKNLQTVNVDVDKDFIRETWRPVFRRHFLKKRLQRAIDCRKGFYMYHQGLACELDCNDVVLFWRIQQMLRVTVNALRQQVVNREARHLEREVKSVLEDFSQDFEKKQHLLTGRRVSLAEELKKVRQIQDKLEEFIQALSQEK
ncbi:unnamed protein product [Notodromas monacha]|uniref:Dynamin-like GTPase OPA1, mitochondrial n=1 Tax=Notodromas monacha TaxID=399045 RepID=A0A7R9BNM9_9CRUS|nr:unnamed protein product [Notodromas monacha]CAG0918822.1 unnamed protein product [Notodromas monacha]